MNLLIKNRISYSNQEIIAAFALIIPSFLLLSIFFFYPMIRAFLLSFQDFSLMQSTGSFIGLENYRNLLTDFQFTNSLKNTFLFTILVLPVQTILALSLALLLKKAMPLVGLFRTVYFLPVIISASIAATIFRLIYNKDFGLLNTTLSSMGISKLDFLSDTNIAMYGIVLFGTWKTAGFFMIVFLAGLNNIPSDLYEAAEVDGANSVQKFLHVTIPLLSRTLSFVVMITTMDAFKIFVPIMITMGGGGPAGSTDTIVFFIYKTAFNHMNLGYASAAAFILFTVVMLISVIQMRFFRSDVEY